MHDEWNMLVASRLQSHNGDALSLFCLLIEAIDATKALAEQYVRSQPVCFISYAWEQDNSQNERLQSVLKFLRSLFARLGATVYLDVQDIKSNLEHFMDQRISDSDYIFLIGTRNWNRSIRNPHRNVTREFCQIQTRLSSRPELLVPLLLDGEHQEVFSSDFMKKHLIRDMSGLVDKHLTIAALEKLIIALFSTENPIGIIPLLYQLPQKEYGLVARNLLLGVHQLQTRRDLKELVNSSYEAGNQAIANQQYRAAYEFYLIAARHGHVRAMLHVAKLLAYGHNDLEMDTTTALHWVEKAVKSADTSSQRRYATETSQQVRRKHYEYLAKNGDAEAMKRLAGMLHRREGVVQEQKLSIQQWQLNLNRNALFWLNEAGKKGESDTSLQKQIERNIQQLT